MTPADARTLRRRKVADLRAAEPGLSLRQMARRLGLSRDTVSRDLDEISRRAAEGAPPVEAVAAVVDVPASEAEDGPEAADDSAPQPGEGAAEVAPPVGAEVVVVAEPLAEVAGDGYRERRPLARARLPRRLADTELTIDLTQWPALRRDLAVLAETGISPEALINQAVVVLAHGYRQGLRSGVIRPDRPFVVRDLIVGPPRSFLRDPVPAPAAEGSPGT
ncbi:helix-turn-helix domain-containing protein [Streptomyces sp. MBT65]|uniref:HTH domain-containing protein n=1 Tax=Streptomyces sp. MBT65 TaxID=1488395 RepID=UPI00190C4E7F|nr:HTH domain-containing protein [Streptomyces sp. MBT65]MBK3575109.1 helix-turn-helix domain-containing protein [Streptomyces sp. MBT65]